MSVLIARLNPRGCLHRLSRLSILAACLALGAGMLAASSASAHAASPAAMPKLDHVFVIMEENNGFNDVIGNAAAPNLNYLANTFGLETNYFGVSPCCSESNYVGLLGGNTFNVNSDDAYWKRPALCLQARRHPELHDLVECRGLGPPGADRSAKERSRQWHRAAIQLRHSRRVPRHAW